MNSFRINTVGRNNNQVILEGFRYNNRIFALVINRYNNIINQPIYQYIYSNGIYYTINIMNDINDINNNLNNNINIIWDHPDYENEFPYYQYGISDNVYYYIKGLLMT
jgi:hypothetical protein